MRLIDYDAADSRYYREFDEQDICDVVEDRDWLKRCFDAAPTIAPIKVAGGCYCMECCFKDTFDCPASKNGYTFHGMEHCSYGELGEAQDDG